MALFNGSGPNLKEEVRANNEYLKELKKSTYRSQQNFETIKFHSKKLQYQNHLHKYPILQDKVFSVATYATLQVTIQVASERLLTSAPFDGRKFAKSMYNRTFSTVDGVCELNANGDRDNTYTVLGLSSMENGTLEVYSIYSNICRRRFWNLYMKFSSLSIHLQEIFLFSARNGALYTSPYNISWIGQSSAYLERSYCGFSEDDPIYREGQQH